MCVWRNGSSKLELQTFLCCSDNFDFLPKILFYWKIRFLIAGGFLILITRSLILRKILNSRHIWTRDNSCNVRSLTLHSGPENLKKVQTKKIVKSNKTIFSWNCIFGSFKLFPSSKMDFWQFLKLQKMNLVKKNFMKLIYWFHEFFWPGLFKI